MLKKWRWKKRLEEMAAYIKAMRFRMGSHPRSASLIWRFRMYIVTNFPSLIAFLIAAVRTGTPCRDLFSWVPRDFARSVTYQMAVSGMRGQGFRWLQSIMATLVDYCTWRLWFWHVIRKQSISTRDTQTHTKPKWITPVNMQISPIALCFSRCWADPLVTDNPRWKPPEMK